MATLPTAATLRARLLAALGQPEARLSRAAHRAGNDRTGIAAVRHIAAAARAGLPEAQAKLGLCYLHGQGVPASETEARHWLERAAQGGDVGAQTALASMALRGLSGPYERGPFARPASAEPDNRLAADLARRAAEGGSAEARALLAFLLRTDPSLAGAPEEANALYQASAEAGWPLGQLGHAMTRLGENTPEALREAQDLLQAAAAAHLPTAHFLLGAMTEAGACAAPDLTTAAAHYRRGAEHGHTGSKTRLGLALLTGRGTPRNLVEAETWLRRAAHDGDKTAAALLGDFHANPEQPSPNRAEAARWYRRAAELGHAGSAHALARAITAGAEGQPDPRDILHWLQTAITLGAHAAWSDLRGLILARCLPEDHLPALHFWLQRMIQQNHPEAGFQVGLCLNAGIGTPPDEAMARRYYLWAASLGLIEAMAAAAEMLLNGRGGPSDPDLARALFTHAAKRGHPGAAYALGVMAGDDCAQAMPHFRHAAALGHAKAQTLVERETAQEETALGA